jgi:hypothetical protein
VRRSVVAMLLVLSLAACHSSTKAGARTTTPKIDAVLSDTGLTFARWEVPAGTYLISFEDRRTHKLAGQSVELQFGPDGPRIGFVKVPAGGHVRALLIGNFTAWPAYDGMQDHGARTRSFYVETTKRYPTPAT